MLAAGSTLGPYKLLAPLGAGGMGEVYRAHDTRLGRDVAIKVLPEHLTATPDARARFEREARTISQLHHANICMLFDIGHQDGIEYLVMELLEGETLARRLSRGALPIADVLSVGRQIAEALEAAHRAGVVHRDLKPSNVMLTKAGARLMDFGLARITCAEAPCAQSDSPTMSRPLTAEGRIVGTFQYMAPEQLEGREADARSDLWALGCLLYEMETGHPAFAGKSQASLIAAILDSEPTPMRDLRQATPSALDRVVSQCLAKNPERRVQTAHDVQLCLEWIAESGAQAGAAAAQAQPASQMPGRLGWWVAGALAVSMLAPFALPGRPHEGAGPRPTFTPVTYRPLSIFNAAFAPDGRTIVFSGAPEGNTPRLFIIRPENPDPRPFGEPATHLLSVSARGELAVLTGARYVAHRLFTGTLARMPLDGGAPRELLENVRDAAWAPDGSQLAIVRDVGGRDRLEFPIGHVLVESGGYLSDLKFSPRGDHIAFFDHPERFDDRGSVSVVDLGGRRTVLSDGYWGEEGIAWTPDGKEILFSASVQGFSMSVYAVTPAGRKRVALESAGGQTILDVAADGRWLTSRDDEMYKDFVHTPAWKGEQDVSWLDASVDPIVSRDGREVVFAEQNGVMGNNYAVCLRRTDGGEVVRLGEGSLMDLSADGARVLAQLHSPPRLVVYPTGAGESLRLERGAIENYNAAWWFPGGDSILVSGNEPGRPPRFYVQRLSGGPPVAVTPEGTHDGVLSRDGAFVLAMGPGDRYAIYPLAGGAPRPAPWFTAEDALLRTTADGRSAITYSFHDIPLRVERVDLATGRRSRVADIAPADRSGIVHLTLRTLSDDERSYAYWAAWRRSTLFSVKWAAPGRP